jgi:DNA-binding PadR family transcriptional regulator
VKDRVCLNIVNPKFIVDIPAEDIVKAHLEIIILSMLIEKSMCGYDLIKEIFSRYKVLISQGTVYPLLYSMKEEGILHVESMKGDMKTKRYSVAPDGRQLIEKKIDEFIRAEEFILNSIRKGEP